MILFGIYPHTVWGDAAKGAILSRERMAPLNPQENARGGPLDPRHCRIGARRAARAAQCKCGVHGFAMNPYVSLRLATAPYCREARVTVARRQTACRMRHCCARRIDECSGRRKLGCTSTRLAERQRMIEAEANRLAMLNAATPRAGSRIPEAQRSFKLWTANLSLSLGVSKGPFSFAKENGPFVPLPCAAQGNKVQRCRAVICYP